MDTVHHLSVLLRRTYANSSNAIPHKEGRHSYKSFI